MIDTPKTRAKVARNIWIALRFIVFSVGGFIALWISWLSLIIFVSDPRDPPSERWLSPFLALPLSFIGALMMLYGGGQWRRWAYLWVFVSVPIVVSPLVLLSASNPALDFMFDKGLGIFLFASPMVVSYLLVRRYYQLRDKQNLHQ
jgi:hypothetical protein